MLRAIPYCIFFGLAACVPERDVATAPASVASRSGPGSDLIDIRDGHVYRTVVIGTQVWMAENLVFDTLAGDASHTCDTIGCPAAGRFYTWPGAMGDTSLKNWCDVQAGRKGICPEGWHVPDSAEWNALAREAGGIEIAGRRLKSDSLWKPRTDGTPGAGNNTYGFAAKPYGYWTRGEQGYGWYGHTPTDSAFLEAGYRAAFWTRSNQTHFSCTSAWGMFLSNQDDGIRLLSVPRATALSIRCRRDQDEPAR